MKNLLLALVVSTAVVALTACESLSPYFGGSKSQIEALAVAYVAGTYTVNISKDGKTLILESWICTSDKQTDGTIKMTGCHKQPSQSTVLPAVAPVQ